ncbi:HNH endonuclease, partial [Nocardioides sp. AN3]
HCDRPTSQCEAAHLDPWCEGGRTDLANGALLCPRHHTLADHPDHTIEQLRPGRIRINRRC